jgi:hypothetical protein
MRAFCCCSFSPVLVAVPPPSAKNRLFVCSIRPKATSFTFVKKKKKKKTETNTQNGTGFDAEQGGEFVRLQAGRLYQLPLAFLYTRKRTRKAHAHRHNSSRIESKSKRTR